MGLRFGFDLGSNSLGWSVLGLDDGNAGRTPSPTGVVDMGVRIISTTSEAGREPKSGESLAVARRTARSMRRRRDRFLRRRENLMAALIDQGLMPEDESARKALEPIDPYDLRRRALDERLERHHVGRALFHLHQRRGFQSNRKAEAGDEEAGAIKTGMENTRAEMARHGARTFGELLAMRHELREPVRARSTGEGAKVAFDIYPDRSLTDSEFGTIWDSQSDHHPEMTPAARNEIHAIMFRQRPLRPINPGKCSLYPEDLRAPRAWPVFQRFRILQEVNALRVASLGGHARPLTLAERDRLVAELRHRSSEITFEKMREKLRLDEGEYFTIEGRGRKGLQPDMTAKVLDAKKCFNREWRRLNLAAQQAAIERLLETEEENEVLTWLTREFDVDRERAVVIARSRLPAGHARFGRRALEELLEVLQTQSVAFTDPETGEVWEAPLTYDSAVERLGLHHSYRPVGERRARLPYYGDVLSAHVAENPEAPQGSHERRGRITNPTVHIGLNQLRRVVNALIEAHGPPDQIVLEIGRELKQNAEQKRRTERQQRENEDLNRKRNERLEELGQDRTAENRMRLRLFEEFRQPEAICVYSGERISLQRLFSPDIEIDHILPFSLTLDDGFANRILCTRQANRRKGHRTPFDAFSHTPEWEAIVARTEVLPENKRWRFGADAMARMRRDGDFVARQLTDTQYLARLARVYLEHVCDQVWVTPGRMTAMLRGKWGLNRLLPDHNYAAVAQPKNRLDHRHHAIDALVTACTDRSLLQRIARAAGRAEEQEMQRLLDEMPDPWQNFRGDVGDALERIVVSHKPDHGRRGQLHEATAMGRVRDPEAEDGYNHVVRKPFQDLTEAEIGRIRDRRLRARVEDAVYQAKGAGLGLKTALADFAESDPDYFGIRRVRLLKREEETVEIRHGPDRCFAKSYTPGSNLYVDIYETADGKWAGEGVSVFQANLTPPREPRWRAAHPDAKPVMRLYKGDMIEMDDEGKRRIFRVVQLEPSAKRVRLVAHNEGGKIRERHNDSNDPLRWVFGTYERMRSAHARQVRVDEIGRVWPVEPDS